MRAIILVAGAVLALAACGRNDQAGNTANATEGLTADDIVSNDVTAIDAVTGDAANMAADMDVSFTNGMENAAANAATTNGTAPKPTARTRPVTPAPTSNESSGNETVNAADE